RLLVGGGAFFGFDGGFAGGAFDGGFVVGGAGITVVVIDVGGGVAADEDGGGEEGEEDEGDGLFHDRTPFEKGGGRTVRLRVRVEQRECQRRAGGGWGAGGADEAVKTSVERGVGVQEVVRKSGEEGARAAEAAAAKCGRNGRRRRGRCL